MYISSVKTAFSFTPSLCSGVWRFDFFCLRILCLIISKEGKKKNAREKKGHLILNWINTVVSTRVGKTSYTSINYLTRFAFSAFSPVVPLFAQPGPEGPHLRAAAIAAGRGGTRGRAASPLRGRSAEGPPSGRLCPPRSRGAPQVGIGQLRSAGTGVARRGRG